MATLVTLEQWQALLAVVNSGGYAAAAEELGKSQSSVSYAIQKLESSLGLRAFKIEGRKAVLTAAGKALYQRALLLLDEAQKMEVMAQQMALGWEAEVRLAVDAISPEWVIHDAIKTFQQESPLTRVELRETVLSGTTEALLRRESDIVLCGRVPPGFQGELLMDIKFCLVASPDHALHQLDRPLAAEDLVSHCQLVIKDSGSRDIDTGWLGAQQRLTLSHFHASIQCAIRGLGYAWYPEMKIKSELEQGLLKPLRQTDSAINQTQLYLVKTNGQFAGLATQRLSDLIKETVDSACQLEDC